MYVFYSPTLQASSISLCLLLSHSSLLACPLITSLWSCSLRALDAADIANLHSVASKRVRTPSSTSHFSLRSAVLSLDSQSGSFARTQPNFHYHQTAT
jgi:hypothetical protein